MTITWQNVAAPDLTDVSRMLGQGVAGTANAFSGIANAFDPIKDAAKKQRDNLIKLNTATELDAINSIQDVNALNDYVTKLNRTGLTDRYGQNNVDVEQILAAAAKAPEALVNRINSVNDFKENQLKLAETPLYRDFSEKINLSTDVDSLKHLGSEIASKMNSGFGMELTGKIQSRIEALTRSDRENKEFTMRYEKAKDDERVRLIKNESDKYFGNLYNLIPENLTGDDARAYLHKDLTSKPFYINAPEEDKIIMVGRLNDRINNVDTVFMDPKARRTLMEQQEKFNLDNQPIEASIANTQRLNQENENKIKNYELTTPEGNIFNSVSTISKALSGKQIEGFFVDDNVGINQKDINRISQSIADTVSKVKSDLAEQYSKNPDSEIYQLAAQKAKVGSGEFTDAINNLVSDMMPEGVIKSALKETPTLDPSGSGEIQFNSDALAKQIKIHVGKYSGSLNTRKMLNKQYQKEVNEFGKTKREQKKLIDISLMEQLRNAANTQ